MKVSKLMNLFIVLACAGMVCGKSSKSAKSSKSDGNHVSRTWILLLSEFYSLIIIIVLILNPLYSLSIQSFIMWKM